MWIQREIFPSFFGRFLVSIILVLLSKVQTHYWKMMIFSYDVKHKFFDKHLFFVKNWVLFNLVWYVITMKLYCFFILQMQYFPISFIWRKHFWYFTNISLHGDLNYDSTKRESRQTRHVPKCHIFNALQLRFCKHPLILAFRYHV